MVEVLRHHNWYQKFLIILNKQVRRPACFFHICVVLIISSCSIPAVKTKKQNLRTITLDKYSYLNKDDYIEQLKRYKSFYLVNDEIEVLKLSKNSSKYLKNHALRIIQHNELFFRQSENVEFYLIQSSIPFHFSLPERKIFISSGLVQRYIKHEGILASIIAYELVRSEKIIYNKNIIIPTGYLSTERVLGLLRISLEDKIEAHKWAFHSIKRAGYDFDHYLGWIQVQNRNSLDFGLMLGERSSIAREEALFKSFMIRSMDMDLKEKKRTSSSRNFYRFLKEVSRTRI
jgi:hypothetical protein